MCSCWQVILSSEEDIINFIKYSLLYQLFSAILHLRESFREADKPGIRADDSIIASFCGAAGDPFAAQR
jgi:hypothetical protein